MSTYLPLNPERKNSMLLSPATLTHAIRTWFSTPLGSKSSPKSPSAVLGQFCLWRLWEGKNLAFKVASFTIWIRVAVMYSLRGNRHCEAIQVSLWDGTSTSGIPISKRQCTCRMRAAMISRYNGSPDELIFQFFLLKPRQLCCPEALLPLTSYLLTQANISGACSSFDPLKINCDFRFSHADNNYGQQ